MCPGVEENKLQTLSKDIMAVYGSTTASSAAGDGRTAISSESRERTDGDTVRRSSSGVTNDS